MNAPRILHYPGENKCNRCGINLRHQEYECCEPCLNEMLLGHPANHQKWNQFVLTLTDALINRDRSPASAGGVGTLKGEENA